MVNSRNKAKITHIGDARAVSPDIQGGFLRRMSTYLQRANFAQLFGQAFGGKRNYNEVFGYPSILSSQEMWEMYYRGGVAHRIIHAYPDAVWGRPPQLYVPNNPEWNAQWDTLVKKTKLWTYIHKADILAGLGRYSILLIGTNKGNLEQKLTSAKEITFFQPYAERNVTVSRWDRDPTSPRFGQPEIYTVTPNVDKSVYAGDATTTAPSIVTSFKVHWSRVLHISHGTLESPVYGTPLYAPIWNYLIDLIKVVGSSAESYWMTAYQGMHANVDPEMELDEEDANDLSEEIDEYQHGLRRFIRTRGVEVKSLGSTVADPRGAFDVLLTLISGTTGIPKRILLGSEAGQLASSQDKGNWADRVEEKRQNHAEPNIIMPFLKWLNDTSILENNPEEVQLLWPEAYRMSPLERSQTSAQTARTIANISKGLQPTMITPAIPAVTGPDGSVITPEVPAVTGEALVTHAEARKLIGLSTDQQVLVESPT